MKQNENDWKRNRIEFDFIFLNILMEIENFQENQQKIPFSESYARDERSESNRSNLYQMKKRLN